MRQRHTLLFGTMLAAASVAVAADKAEPGAAPKTTPTPAAETTPAPQPASQPAPQPVPAARPAPSAPAAEEVIEFAPCSASF